MTNFKSISLVVLLAFVSAAALGQSRSNRQDRRQDQPQGDDDRGGLAKINGVVTNQKSPSTSKTDDGEETPDSSEAHWRKVEENAAARRELEGRVSTFRDMSYSDSIEAASRTYLNVPYVMGANGEAQDDESDASPVAGFDAQAEYRFDAFDCTTYVETMVALSLADNAESFRRNLRTIRYSQGHDANAPVSYLNRNHFTEADWIPNNQYDARTRPWGLLTEATMRVGGGSAKDGGAVQWTDIIVDKGAWFRRKTMQDMSPPAEMSLQDQEAMLEAVHRYGRNKDLGPKKFGLDYIPTGALVGNKAPSEYDLQMLRDEEAGFRADNARQLQALIDEETSWEKARIKFKKDEIACDEQHRLEQQQRDRDEEWNQCQMNEDWKGHRNQSSSGNNSNSGQSQPMPAAAPAAPATFAPVMGPQPLPGAPLAGQAPSDILANAPNPSTKPPVPTEPAITLSSEAKARIEARRQELADSLSAYLKDLTSLPGAAARRQYWSNAAMLRRIPNGAVISIVNKGLVRGGTPLLVSHQGIVIQRDGVTYFRNAARGSSNLKLAGTIFAPAKTVEVSLAWYLRRWLDNPSSRVVGINIQEVRDAKQVPAKWTEPKPAYNCRPLPPVYHQPPPQYSRDDDRKGNKTTTKKQRPTETFRFHPGRPPSFPPNDCWERSQDSRQLCNDKEGKARDKCFDAVRDVTDRCSNDYNKRRDAAMKPFRDQEESRRQRELEEFDRDQADKAEAERLEELRAKRAKLPPFDFHPRLLPNLPQNSCWTKYDTDSAKCQAKSNPDERNKCDDKLVSTRNKCESEYDSQWNATMSEFNRSEAARRASEEAEHYENEQNKADAALAEKNRQSAEKKRARCDGLDQDRQQQERQQQERLEQERRDRGNPPKPEPRPASPFPPTVIIVGKPQQGVI